MYRLFLLILLSSSSIFCMSPEDLREAQRGANIEKTVNRLRKLRPEPLTMPGQKIKLGNPGQSARLTRNCKRHTQTFYPNTPVYIPR